MAYSELKVDCLYLMIKCRYFSKKLVYSRLSPSWKNMLLTDSPESCSLVWQAKFIVPRHKRETFMPVLPVNVYRIVNSFLHWFSDHIIFYPITHASAWKMGFRDSAICLTFSNSCLDIGLKFKARSKAMRNSDSSPGGIAAVIGWLRVKYSPNLASSRSVRG